MLNGAGERNLSNLNLTASSAFELIAHDEPQSRKDDPAWYLEDDQDGSPGYSPSAPLRSTLSTFGCSGRFSREHSGCAFRACLCSGSHSRPQDLSPRSGPSPTLRSAQGVLTLRVSSGFARAQVPSPFLWFWCRAQVRSGLTLRFAQVYLPTMYSPSGSPQDAPS